ncbi:DMT family transporter [Aeromicrobium phragmitis]|uniref:DMT family transporter n=1 Tax=Aeromicrobium phragmitis TaxID=2478914 RepID=A0A3L8PP89_9ACTN|nr:DMT family transporter [Aeromicrobium phragmitis]RLV57206.1 DMT family transporter [Aeromicrobium phragmitis]
MRFTGGPDCASTTQGHGAGTAAHVGVRATLAIAVTITAWASSFVVIRAIGAELSPGPLALLRVSVALAALTPLSLVGPRPLLPRGRTLVLVAAYGSLWFGLYHVLLNGAERYVDAGTAALLIHLSPLLVALGAGWLLSEGFPRPLLIGSAVALGGVAVMTNATAGGDKGTGIGIVLGLFAALVYAASVLLQKSALPSLSGVRAVWLGCLFGVLALLPFTPATIREVSASSATALAGAVYLGIVPTAVAFWTWGYALRRMPAGRLSPLVAYLVTVVAMAFSWLFLDEAPETRMLLGGLACLVGVAISQWTGPLRRARIVSERTRPTVDGSGPGTVRPDEGSEGRP